MVSRFHLSKKKIQTFYDTNQINFNQKPVGFWYSIDTLFDKTNGLTFNITNTNHCCFVKILFHNKLPSIYRLLLVWRCF